MPQPPETYPRLVGDVGGTNARFGIVSRAGAPVAHIDQMPCADFAGPAEAIRAYLRDQDLPTPRYAAIGIANPVLGDQIKMTNHTWSFSIEEQRSLLSVEDLLFINDFTALALSVPLLSEAERLQVGGGVAKACSPIGVIGPGTGLGVSGLVPTSTGSYVPLQGEGGHVTVSPQTDEEMEVVRLLSQTYGHVSAERLVSGPGIQAIYHCLASLREQDAESLSPAQITARASDGSDPLCVDAVDMFCAVLGTTAGNLALTLGALGGVFIGGGVVPKITDLFIQSRFRERFEAKGRFAQYQLGIPTYVITSPYAALIGAAAALDRTLA